ncbi:acyl carrier protein [Dictyobacter aurantiacus]|uniref:Carrier domain-containing protein n=1 Tax=Dictyobacter aurantiacus TaxID=1936993 RepID=A0A401ZST3_9CHLR|nr:acyl carrier protein [Dictyobacter aurantiacus]GCE09921.1 hypothetical protein KDAU_72500 [Dictyobacter aurantiacus]
MTHNSREQDIYPRVATIIRHQVDEDDEITLDTDLLTDLGIESLSFIEIGLAMEKAFGQQFPIADLKRCTTVGDLVQLVIKKVPEEEAASK